MLLIIFIFFHITNLGIWDYYETTKMTTYCRGCLLNHLKMMCNCMRPSIRQIQCTCPYIGAQRLFYKGIFGESTISAIGKKSWERHVPAGGERTHLHCDNIEFRCNSQLLLSPLIKWLRLAHNIATDFLHCKNFDFHCKNLVYIVTKKLTGCDLLTIL